MDKIPPKEFTNTIFFVERGNVEVIFFSAVS